MNKFSFQIEVQSQRQTAKLEFATKQQLERYHRSFPSAGNPASPAARDAVEFTRLAAERWRYYSDAGEAAESFQTLKEAIVHNEHCEVAFILIATTRRGDRELPVGLAYVRRTWCHHLALDFLALHPKALDQRENVAGLGSGIVYSLVRLAKSLHIQCIWGEATAHSAAFYERLLAKTPILDLFVIESQEMKAIQDRQQKIGH